jgi:hypothetical protein
MHTESSICVASQRKTQTTLLRFEVIFAHPLSPSPEVLGHDLPSSPHGGKGGRGGSKLATAAPFPPSFERADPPVHHERTVAKRRDFAEYIARAAGKSAGMLEAPGFREGFEGSGQAPHPRANQMEGGDG